MNIVKSSVFLGVTALGFVVGLAIGQRTRQATESNTKVAFEGGVVTVQADLYKSVKQGTKSALYDYLGVGY